MPAGHIEEVQQLWMLLCLVSGAQPVIGNSILKSISEDARLGSPPDKFTIPQSVNSVVKVKVNCKNDLPAFMDQIT